MNSYNLEDMSEMVKAEVTINGAIRLGNYIACDAHDSERPVRIVTHAHIDHIIGLQKSLKQSEMVIMTKATKDLIKVLYHKNVDNVTAVNYNEKIGWKDEKITLIYADHIIGAAQVLVETENERLVYTGDFRLPKTPIIEADILVIEATYGKPKFKRPPMDVIRDSLIKLVSRSIAREPVHIFGFHGKVQEVMELLRDEGINVPFIATRRVYEVTQICRQHGMRIGEVYLKSSKEACEIMKSNQYIMFHHASTLNRVKINGVKIHLTGWEFRRMVWQVSENEYRVALSDHADFTQLMLYVATSKPKLVITDNYRVGYATELAKQIEKRLGIKAVPMPLKHKL